MTSTPDASVAEAEPVEVDLADAGLVEAVVLPEPDPRLIAARDVARAALAEITPDATIGDPAGYAVEPDGVVSLRFANRLGGYPGWFWTVSVAAADADAEPTVLEAELLPGDGALTAPDWVPWATRLADYQAAQVALAAAGIEVDDLDADDLDEDDDDLDEDDTDDDEGAAPSDGSAILHAGDLDGVDIDELDDEADDLDDTDGDETDGDETDGDETDADETDADETDADETDADDDLDAELDTEVEGDEADAEQASDEAQPTA